MVGNRGKQGTQGTISGSDITVDLEVFFFDLNEFNSSSDVIRWRFSRGQDVL